MWYNKVVENLSNIPDCLDYFNKKIEEAKKDIRLSGNLEKQSAALPGLIEYWFNHLQELEAILEFLNIQKRKTRAKIYRKFLENYNRQLSSSDANKFVDGEKEVIEIEELVNEVALVRNHYIGILKALDIKGFQIGNITKLKVSGIEDAEVQSPYLKN